MDQVVTLSWANVLQGVAGIGLISVIAVVAGAIVSRFRAQAGGYWIMAWGSLLMTGALYLGADAGYDLLGRLALVSDGLFGPLMFMGALELHREEAPPWWPVAVGAAGGVLRIGSEALGLPDLEAVSSATIAPAFMAAAAITTWRARPRATFRWPIAALLGALVGFELWDAWLDWSREENQILWQALIVIGVPLAALQIASRLLALGEGLNSARQASDVAERQLDLERWRKEVVFEHVRELVAELGADTKILYVNRRARELMGLEPDDLIGRLAIDYVPEANRYAAEEVWRGLLKTGGLEKSIEFPLFDAKGDPLYLDINVAEYELGLEKRFLVIARDVTDRRLLENQRVAHEQALEAAVAERSEQLRASLARLRDQDRLAAVGTLASGIAHQINNPVGAISAAAEFALLSKDDEEAQSIQEQSLERILDEAQRAGRIVKSILRFARHESTTKWREDLGSVVRRSVELVRPYVTERGGTLSIDAAAEALPVLMSPIELEQMMVNLIRNAAESGAEGTEIVVSTRSTQGAAVLEIRDNGRGIPSEVRSQVFDPFYTTRLREGGSGLGLAVVHGIVTDHRAQIDIQSEAGEGTCVRIRFPLEEGEAPLG